MSKCWMLNAYRTYVRYFCADDAYFVAAPQFRDDAVSVRYVVNGENRSLFADINGSESWVYESSSSLTSGTTKPSNPGLPEYGSCDGCLASLKYDCINGQCIAKTQYNTPGVYQSLSDCQAVCANGGACGSGKQCVDPTTFCPGGKVCIDQGEFASIEALISQIGSEVC